MMKTVRLTDSGNISDKDKKQLGGSFSFFQSLKLSGVGSSKINYLSGIEEFDSRKSKTGINSAVTFETLKKGFLIRFRAKHDFLGCLLPYSEITDINITEQKLSITFRGVTKIVSEALIVINVLNKHNIRLYVQPTYFKSVIGFFRKSPVNSICKTSVSKEVRDGNEKGNWIFDLLDF